MMHAGLFLDHEKFTKLLLLTFRPLVFLYLDRNSRLLLISDVQHFTWINISRLFLASRLTLCGGHMPAWEAGFCGILFSAKWQIPSKEDLTRTLPQHRGSQRARGARAWGAKGSHGGLQGGLRTLRVDDSRGSTIHICSGRRGSQVSSFK